MARLNDQQLAEYVYNNVRVKGAPRWETLTSLEREELVAIVSQARQRALSIAARPRIVGGNSDGPKQSP